MNKVKKRGLWGRMKDAARAFAGKPASSITLGLEVKRCSECELAKIVRCKDCKSYSDGGKCRKCNLWRNAEDFCSRGEKKEAET
jgi:DNA-binding IscR family transcriptional regulator